MNLVSWMGYPISAPNLVDKHSFSEDISLDGHSCHRTMQVGPELFQN